MENLCMILSEREEWNRPKLCSLLVSLLYPPQESQKSLKSIHIERLNGPPYQVEVKEGESVIDLYNKTKEFNAIYHHGAMLHPHTILSELDPPFFGITFPTFLCHPEIAFLFCKLKEKYLAKHPPREIEFKEEYVFKLTDMWIAARYNLKEAILAMRRQDPPCVWSDFVSENAVRGGHKDLLLWLKEQGCPISTSLPEDAAKSKNLELLKWLRRFGNRLVYTFPPPRHGQRWMSWGTGVWNGAAASGHIPTLEWLSKQVGSYWGRDTCAYAALHNHKDAILWLHGQNPPCPWNERTCTFAAKGGHLALLQFLRSQGCPWNKSTTGLAAAHDHLHILEYTQTQDPPCPLHKYAFYHATRNGHLRIIEWLREHNCPWYDKAKLREEALRCHQPHIVKYFDNI